MQINEDTLAILDNFSSINDSIMLKAGSEIKTISEAQSILARAVVPDKFSVDCGIYNLRQFLSAVSLFDEPDFTFMESQVVVSGDGNKNFVYNYSDPSLWRNPPEGSGGVIKYDKPMIQFNLSQSNIKMLMKAAGVLSVPHVVVCVLDGLLSVRVMDMSTPTSSNSFLLDIDDESVVFDDEFKASNEFDEYKATFMVNNLKILSGNYDVRLANNGGLAHFINEDISLEYWVASETTFSTVFK